MGNLSRCGLILFSALSSDRAAREEIRVTTPSALSQELQTPTPVAVVKEDTRQKIDTASKPNTALSPEFIERNHTTNTEAGFWDTATILEGYLRARGLEFTLTDLSSKPGIGFLLWKIDGETLYSISFPDEEHIDFNYAFNVCFQEFDRTDGNWVAVDVEMIKKNSIAALMRAILPEVGVDMDPPKRTDQLADEE